MYYNVKKIVTKKYIILYIDHIYTVSLRLWWQTMSTYIYGTAEAKLVIPLVVWYLPKSNQDPWCQFRVTNLGRAGSCIFTSIHIKEREKKSNEYMNRKVLRKLKKKGAKLTKFLVLFPILKYCSHFWSFVPHFWSFGPLLLFLLQKKQLRN